MCSAKVPRFIIIIGNVKMLIRHNDRDQHKNRALLQNNLLDLFIQNNETVLDSEQKSQYYFGQDEFLTRYWAV